MDARIRDLREYLVEKYSKGQAKKNNVRRVGFLFWFWFVKHGKFQMLDFVRCMHNNYLFCVENTRVSWKRGDSRFKSYKKKHLVHLSL